MYIRYNLIEAEYKLPDSFLKHMIIKKKEHTDQPTERRTNKKKHGKSSPIAIDFPSISEV